MTFRNSQIIPMSPEELVGVAIQATGHGDGMHVGLLYVEPEGDCRFVHLAFHHDLRNELAPNDHGYWWAGCAWLAGEEQLANAEFLAEYIWACSQNTDVDYGFNPPPVAFGIDGKYDALNPSKGLTCATFVASVLKCGGFPVVRLEEWERRVEDDAWKQSVLRLLCRFGHQDRAEQIGHEEIAFRLKPDEAAAAAASQIIPLGLAQTIAIAEPLKDLLFP